MLVVGHSSSNPGLTKPWKVGELERYYPTGVRNYARVIATDDFQGQGAAAFAANDLKATKAFVLNDNQAYGIGVAKAFVENAPKNGIQIVGEQAWDAKQPNYTALYQSVKASRADMVYLGGIYDNNGGQLIKDKVCWARTTGRSSCSLRMASPAYPDMRKLQEAEGMYLMFIGLTNDQLVKAGGAGPSWSRPTRPSTARIRMALTRSME
jgi:branched-chain amino acid transport system substrate-binding protein